MDKGKGLVFFARGAATNEFQFVSIPPFSLKVVSTTFLLVCFVCLKEALVKQEKCFLFHFKSFCCS